MINSKGFFWRSDWLDRYALRPLSHIKANWELSWDHDKEEYFPEEESYAEMLNQLTTEIGKLDPPLRYHDNEDRLAEYVRDNLKWKIAKVGGQWEGADYSSILEQGGYDDIDEKDLILAAAGRIQAAMKHGQNHFDEMEEGHAVILAYVIAIILYHRTD